MERRKEQKATLLPRLALAICRRQTVFMQLPQCNERMAKHKMRKWKTEAMDENVGGPEIHMMFDNNVLMDDELAESDEDMMDVDDAEEEMVAFAVRRVGSSIGRRSSSSYSPSVASID